MDMLIIDGMSFALPLLIIAIGGIYCERSGVVNLALEGFMGVGAFCGALSVVVAQEYFITNPNMLFIISIIFAMLGATLYSLLHALLCIKFNANQVISGVVMNILAIALTTFLTSQMNELIFGKPSSRLLLGVSSRFTVPIISDIPILGAFFTNMYPFYIIIIILGFIAWYILYKTPYGMHLRACGDNPHAVDAAGIDVARVRTIAIMFSGAFAGLGGVAFAYSISASFSSNFYMGYGYLAIAALIFGNWKIPPTLIACLVFGFARSGGYLISQMLELPSAYSDLVMTLPYFLTLLLLMFFSKNNKQPKALGEIYDKGKR